MFKNLMNDITKKFNFYKWYSVNEFYNFIIKHYELKSEDNESLAWLVLNHLVSEGYIKLNNTLVIDSFMIVYIE